MELRISYSLIFSLCNNKPVTESTVTHINTVAFKDFIALLELNVASTFASYKTF